MCPAGAQRRAHFPGQCIMLHLLRGASVHLTTTSCMLAPLQAAATGETLLDEELSSLARKNVGRFHSLNQRLQAQGAAGPSRWGNGGPVSCGLGEVQCGD